MSCMVFLCGSLFANAFFFQTDGSDLNIAQTITTGIFASLLVILPTSAVVFIFRRARPSKMYGRASKSSVHPLDDAENAVATSSKYGNNSDGLVALVTLPSWCRVAAWFVSIALCIWCSYYVLLLSFEWGPQTSWAWLSAVFTSVGMMAAITDPLFILVFALVGTTCCGGIGRGTPMVDETRREAVNASSGVIHKLTTERAAVASRDSKPPGISWVVARQEVVERERQMRSIFIETVRYLFFYGSILAVFMKGPEDDAMVLLGSVVNTVAQGEDTHAVWDGKGSLDSDTMFADVETEADYFEWLEACIEAMHTDNWNPSLSMFSDQQLYFIGVPRLRQLRVRANTCTVPEGFQGRIEGCYGGWSSDTDATNTYLAHSSNNFSTNTTRRQRRKGKYIKKKKGDLVKLCPLSDPQCTVDLDLDLESDTGATQSVPHTIDVPPSGWTYGADEYTYFWGDYLHTMYDHPGYTQLIPSNNATAAINIVQSLKDARWIDHATRFCVLELTLYAPARDRIVTVRLGAEFLATGGERDPAALSLHAARSHPCFHLLFRLFL